MSHIFVKMYAKYIFPDMNTFIVSCMCEYTLTGHFIRYTCSMFGNTCYLANHMAANSMHLVI